MTTVSRDSFVGRHAHLEEVEALLDRARQGSGCLVLVSGEAGIGKTRFAEEAAGLAERTGAAVAWGQCTEEEGAPPFLPWSQVFRQLAAVAPRPRALDWRNSAAHDGSRFQLFEEALEALHHVATTRPLLVVLDDLQWADSASLNLLRYAASHLPSIPALVVATHREAGEDAAAFESALAGIRRQRGVRRLSLGPLPPAAARDLARRSLAEPTDPEVVRSILRRAEGNPLFIRELASLVSERGASPLDLPPTVHAVIATRMLNLGSDGRALLRAAAVLGVDFDIHLLEQVSGRPESQVVRLLADAALRRLVAGSANRRHFTHPLVREVMYAELPDEDRVRLHAEAAEALRATLGDASEPRAELIAHHLRQAAPLVGSAPALEATLAAAADAEAAFAHEDAVTQLTLAMELATQVRMRGTERTALLLRLARGRFRAGAIVPAWDACRSAAAEARVAGDWATVADAATVIRGAAVGELAGEIDAVCCEALAALPEAELTRRAKLLAQRVLVADPWLPRPDPNLGTDALRAAEVAGDADARFMALQARREELALPEHCLERLSGGDRALRLAQDSGRAEYAVWGHTWRIDTLWELGRRVQLDAEVVALAGVVDRLREPLHRWRLRMIQAAIRRLEGRFADAFALLDEALEIGRAAGHEEAEVLDMVARANMATEIGGGDEYERVAARQAEMMGSVNSFARYWQGAMLAAADQAKGVRHLWPELVDRFDRFPQNIAWIPMLSSMADMCCLVRDRAFARSLYATLLPYADREVVSDARGGSRGPVALYLGNLAALLGKVEDAEALLQRAVARAQEMGSPPYEAIARHALAAAWITRKGHDRAAAAREIERAATAASRLGMLPLERRTSRLAHELDRTASGGRLSPREFEVAALVAEGLSNQGIAQRLHLSSRTAENHVQHIMQKLGFDSRAQIAAWFVTANLSRGFE